MGDLTCPSCGAPSVKPPYGPCGACGATWEDWAKTFQVELDEKGRPTFVYSDDPPEFPRIVEGPTGGVYCLDFGEHWVVEVGDADQAEAAARRIHDRLVAALKGGVE